MTYADIEHGHQGTIYKAANFTYVGQIKGAKVIMHNGKRYHDKTIRTKYKGRLKPFAVKLKQALENGAATYHQTQGKHVFTYNVKRAKQ